MVCESGTDLTLPCWLLPWRGGGNSARRHSNQEAGPRGFCHYLEKRLAPTITVRRVDIRVAEQPGARLCIELSTHSSPNNVPGDPEAPSASNHLNAPPQILE